VGEIGIGEEHEIGTKKRTGAAVSTATSTSASTTLTTIYFLKIKKKREK